jgi:filamentous hemagglutinin family protein
LGSAPAKAQLVPDSTLGAENSAVTPNVNINGIPSDRIDGGATRGANLFHSFREFNIGEGRGVYFTNPSGIENILTRVTGGNPSNILGTLGVLGNANLFLINPKGIVFGPKARLDVRGSFLASAASSLVFNNGLEFSAANPEAPPVLAVNIPIGLRFRENPGNILNQSVAADSTGNPVGLQVDTGKTLALLGGNLELQGGILTANRGRIELGSVAGESLVSISPAPQGFTLGYEGVRNFQDIQLSQQAAADASGEGGGDIQVRGRRLSLRDGSQIRANTRGSQAGGNVTVTADEVELIGRSADSTQPSGLLARVEETATGNGGDVRINARRLSVQNGARVAAASRGQGAAGNVTIRASEAVEIIGPVFTQISASTEGGGSAGDVSIETGRLIARDGGQVVNSTFGAGGAGELTVNADRVELIGRSADSNQPSGLLARVEETATGNGGNLQINTRRLSVQNGARVAAASRTLAPLNPASQGQAGNVTIRASEEVEIIGPALTQISASTGGAGNAGDVRIETGRLIARDGGQVINSIFATGSAGELTVNADEVELIGRSADSTQPSGLLARVEETATGNGGDVRINARRLSVGDGARVSVASRGQQGIPGDITLQTRDIQLRNGVISATAIRGAAKGNIDIATETIVLLRQSGVLTDAQNPQGGSNILIAPPPGENLVLFQSPDSIINASGQLTIQGNIQFSSPDVPQVEVVDPAEQIAQNPCTRGQGSEFTITGSGGLPPSPNDALSSDAVRVGLVEPAPFQNTGSQAPEHPPIPHAQSPNPIVPARGWAFNSKGEVILTAYDSAGSLPERPQPKPAGCR